MQEPGAPEPKPSLIETIRHNASDLQRETAARQAEAYEYTIFHLMDRSGDSPELVNAARDFVQAFQCRVMVGSSEEPLSLPDQARLAAFLKEAAERLGENVEVAIPDRQ